MGLAFLVEATVEMLLLVPSGSPRWGLAYALLAAMAASLAVRRRVPVAATVVTWVVFVALSALPSVYTEDLVTPFFVLLFNAYSAGRHVDDRRLAATGAFGVVAMWVAFEIDSYADTPLSYLTSAIFGVAAPILLGRFVRHRTQLHATLREKAERLDAERAARADDAAAAERTRIAAELHDVVAHALSAMVVQAAGARRLATRDPAQAASAFGAVEETGREALGEIRRMLGILRREDHELALDPPPSLRHVESLVHRVRAAGLPVDLSVEGEPVQLPAGVDLTAYRVVQEALSGALEHGGAERAAVQLQFAGDHVELRIDDDGEWPERPLTGVRERVSLYGGQLRANARRDGGHVVRASLPLEERA